jgi:hypothetical protein
MEWPMGLGGLMDPSWGNTHGTQSQLKWAFALQNGRCAVPSKFCAVFYTIAVFSLFKQRLLN